MTDWHSEMTNDNTDWYGSVIQEQAALHSIPKKSYGSPITGMGGSPGPTAEEKMRTMPIKGAEGGPGFLESMRLGTMEDTQTKIDQLAKKRFPSLPLEEARKRYGVVGGDIIFVDDEGQLNREISGFISGSGEFLGESGPAIVGGVIGGMTGGPGGAALGAAGGEALKKDFALTQGDKQTALGNLRDLGIEAILNAVGWKVGDLFGKKIIDRRTVKDIAKFDKSQTEKLMDTARRYGIELTPAEASDLGSLIAQQTRLGMSFDDAGDIIRQFYQRRAQQVDRAVNQELGGVPPASEVGAEARTVGKQFVEDARSARDTAAGPMYDLAKNKTLIPEKEFMRFESDDYIRGILDKIASDPKYGLMDTPRNSFQVIDQAKKAIDDEISTALRAGKKYEAQVIAKKRDALVRLADQKFPGYKEARDVWRRQNAPVEEAENSLLGQLAGLKDTRLASVADKILSSKNIDAADVRQARRIFSSQGKEKSWDDLINVYLRRQWEDIRLPQSGSEINKGANFKKAVFGTERQQKILEAAMGPKRFKSFKDLMDVLEATGRVPKGQSMTQPAQVAAKEEAFEVSPLASRAKVDIADPLSSFNLRDWWVNAKVKDWQTQIANVITNPGSLKELEKLRKLKSLSPASQDAISITSTAIVKSLYGGADKVLSSRERKVPSILNQRDFLKAAP